MRSKTEKKTFFKNLIRFNFNTLPITHCALWLNDLKGGSIKWYLNAMQKNNYTKGSLPASYHLRIWRGALHLSTLGVAADIS